MHLCFSCLRVILAQKKYIRIKVAMNNVCIHVRFLRQEWTEAWVVGPVLTWRLHNDICITSAPIPASLQAFLNGFMVHIVVYIIFFNSF